MINTIFTAATAANVVATSTAVRSNNLANINTPSFKSSSTTFKENLNGGVGISSIRENNNPPYLIPTGNPNDVAVIKKYDNYERNPRNNQEFSGESSNTVNYENSEIYNAFGEYASKRFSIDDFGNLRAPNKDLLFTGAGGNVRLDNEGGLYQNGEQIGTLRPMEDGEYTPTGLSFLEGYMAGSNVDLAREMVGLNIDKRFLEFNALTIQTSDSMLKSIRFKSIANLLKCF